MEYDPTVGYVVKESKDGMMEIIVKYPGTFSKITLELTPQMKERLLRHVAMGKAPERSALFQEISIALHLLLTSLDGHDLHPLRTVMKELKKRLVDFEEYTNKIKGRSPIATAVLPPIIKF